MFERRSSLPNGWSCPPARIKLTRTSAINCANSVMLKDTQNIELRRGDAPSAEEIGEFSC